MTIIEKTDNKLTIPVGIGVVQTETTRNFYNTSDATATANDILVDKVAYGKYGKLTGTLDLEAEKEISYQDGYETGKTDGYESGYDIGYGNGYTEGETNGYNNGYTAGETNGYSNGYTAGETNGYSNGYTTGVADGVVEGKNEIIEGQSDATITPQNVLRGYVGYGKDNERIVGESDAITTIDVGASGIKFGYSSFTEIPSYYDFNNLTNIGYMFYECRSLTSVPLFDTSNVTTMYSMLYNCVQLTSVPEFDTSNVTNIAYMFSGCSKLTSVPEFDTSNVTNMNNMFYQCSRLTSISELNCQSINNNLPNYYYNAVLYNCSSLSEFGGFKDLGKGFTGSSSKSFYMGTNLQMLTHESMINTFNGLYDLTTTSYTGTATFWVSKYPYDILTEEDIAIATNKGWTVSRYNG